MLNLTAARPPGNLGCRCWADARTAIRQRIADARGQLATALETNNEPAACAARTALAKSDQDLTELEKAVADDTLARLELVRFCRPAEYADHLAGTDPLADTLDRLDVAEGAITDLQATDSRGVTP